MKTLSPPQSGKLGNRVASRNHYGYYLRRRPGAHPAPTPARRRSQQHLRAALAHWNTLADATRQAWITLARTRKAKSTLGRSGSLTGQALFIKLNAAQAALGLPPLINPPSLPQFALNPLGTFSIIRSGRRIRLLLEVPSLPDALIRVSASPPCNAGRSRCWDLRLLGPLPPPVDGQSDLTPLYLAKYGPPSPGKRIFLEIRQQLDGWQDFPRQTSALVPPSPGHQRNRPEIDRK